MKNKIIKIYDAVICLSIVVLMIVSTMILVLNTPNIPKVYPIFILILSVIGFISFIIDKIRFKKLYLQDKKQNNRKGKVKMKNKYMEDMIGMRFYIDDEETEIKEIQKEIEEILGCYVIIGYDHVYSHKYKTEEREDSDFIINYEIYKNENDRNKNLGGDDGQVHELFYLKGNGDYIVITEV